VKTINDFCACALHAVFGHGEGGDSACVCAVFFSLESSRSYMQS